jgi:diguanylate cyclase (GGDEF)-like protein
MENCFEELDSKKESSYFIIMGDLNGLKLVNDRLGHKLGNNLLVIISNIFKKSCDEDDIIARWGGDEFVVLVTNKPRKYVEKLVDDIRYECLQINDFKFGVSMAIGYAEKSSEFKDTDAVMSLAERRMYRNKLMEDNSSRNATISSLRRTLHEKHSETEEHTLRIKNLGVKLGQRLGLSQDKLDELELLAMLHDIGKVGIPEHILMKPGKLTNEEWVIMKTHTEIGYRIARSTPELSHIAEEILYHHERYDGTGYPQGIKGEEIPILSRIINVVDSFDVMTHRRIYKESFSVDFAFEEIKRCSGTQFDPHIAQEFMDMLKEDIEK